MVKEIAGLEDLVRSKFKMQVANLRMPDLEGTRLPAEIVLQAENVILTKIASPLDFDKHKRLRADVLDPVSGADRHVNNPARRNTDLIVVERDLGGARNNHPMFRPMGVLLVAEALVWKNLDPLDFVVIGFIQDSKPAPRPLFGNHGRTV